jgi:hypothetical protein
MSVGTSDIAVMMIIDHAVINVLLLSEWSPVPVSLQFPSESPRAIRLPRHHENPMTENVMNGDANICVRRFADSFPSPRRHLGHGRFRL